ncbi:snRNA-activating protein complex subunit 2-like [Branchiostoma floridae]|uniref:snRNA-activating protein complex subunit 2-like n=1 Tax=Branchiostoma floridae TaxID=7739 RepID=A0A9J7N1E8_BRAFL|nr:snRNA-activating protein complex subunit 2-like [Branchiostoma floridae]
MKPPKRQRKAAGGYVHNSASSYRRFTLSTKWSLKDKKKLLSALKKVSRQDDYNIIKKYVKNKTVEEIEEYVTQMKKRAESLASKGIEKEKQAEKTPVETWLDTCSDLMSEVPPECLQAFSQVLTVAAAEPANLEEPDDSPDYPAIYNYLSCLLRNAPPPTLKPLDSAVVLELIQSLADRLKTTDLSQLKDWLQRRYHDLKKSYVPERYWQNPFNLTEEDLSLCEPPSTDHDKVKDSAEQRVNKKQTSDGNSRGRNTEAASTADILDSKSSSEDTARPSTSTVEPSTSSAGTKTRGGGKKQMSVDGGTKEAEEIICLNPLRIPARYLELEKLDFEKEESDSDEE